MQPYDYIELDITPSERQVQRFISWNLEQEHGDLGLRSKSAHTHKPPHSSLGRDLVASGEAFSLRDQLVAQAGQNMALALARLEATHRMHSLQDLEEPSRDTLPANIVSLFEAGVCRIMGQSPAERQLGLRAIAAVAHEPSGKIRTRELDVWLREVGRLSDDAHALPHRSLEEVIHAAQGFLVTFVPLGEDEFFIAPYCYEFYVFAAEGYSEDLSWAMAELRFGRLSGKEGVKRAQTFQIGGHIKPREMLYRVPMVDRESWEVDVAKRRGKTSQVAEKRGGAGMVRFGDSSSSTSTRKSVQQRLMRRDTASPRMEGTDGTWP
jgi:hypothetical protein